MDCITLAVPGVVRRESAAAGPEISPWETVMPGRSPGVETMLTPGLYRRLQNRIATPRSEITLQKDRGRRRCLRKERIIRFILATFFLMSSEAALKSKNRSNRYYSVAPVFIIKMLFLLFRGLLFWRRPHLNEGG